MLGILFFKQLQEHIGVRLTIVTVIAWEYERQRKKDLDKKAKEDAFRQALDQKYIDEKTVLRFLHYPLLSAAANRHTRLRAHCNSQQMSLNLQCHFAALSALDVIVMSSQCNQPIRSLQLILFDCQSNPIAFLQLLKEENAQQSAMILGMIDRVDKLEQDLHELQEERERQRNSRWGMFSLQGR